MRILFATSEAVPFAKTGGLADVCGALPVELAALGHQVTVMLPAYRQARRAPETITPTDISFDIPIGSKIVRGSLLQSTLPNSRVPVYLIEQDEYFDRPELYREKGEDYKDNSERFIFFSRAVMEAARLLELRPEVIHCHDWQTGLIPALQQLEYHAALGFEETVTLLTIHNLAYQGVFWHWDMLLTGLDWKYFNWHQMEFWGKLNLLKTGIIFADALNTVSPRYAEEIQTPEQGCGLEGVVHDRRGVLTGIMNGVDYSVWNPEADAFLAQKYNAGNWQAGKAACKAALQAEFNLPVKPETPLIGLVGRLADQKGWDLVAQVMQRWLPNVDAQWVVLGTGEPEYHKLLAGLAQQHPGRLALKLDFSDALAHRIEAGADMFLMPSRYEPCGLNQLYSLKYGTVPVVRATGGLADSVTDATPEAIANGTATGFRFDNYGATELEYALGHACDVYHNQRDAWKRLVETGMQQDWSWTASAHHYLDVYRETIARKKQSLQTNG